MKLGSPLDAFKGAKKDGEPSVRVPVEAILVGGSVGLGSELESTFMTAAEPAISSGFGHSTRKPDDAMVLGWESTVISL